MPCLLVFNEIQGGWFVVWRVAAQHCEREPKQTTTHVELLEEGLWTRVQFPPAPPYARARNISEPFFEKIQKVLAQLPKGAYISPVAAILLTPAAFRFDMGSGTPKPHTST